MCKWFLILLAIGTILLAKEPTVSMDFKDVELDVFLQWYSRLTNKRILYNRSKLRSKKVYLISPNPVPESKVENIVLSLLETNGLTLIKGKGAFYKIIETSQASSHPIAIYSEKEIRKIKRGNYYVSQMVLIKYLKATNIINSLKQAKLLSPRSSSVVEIRGANAIIINDFLPNIRRVLKIIRMLDKPPRKVEVAFIKIEHVKANDISQKLGQIFQNRTKELAEYNISGMLTIISDSHTNSLVLRGTKEEIQAARKLLPPLCLKKKVFVPINKMTPKSIFQKVNMLIAC